MWETILNVFKVPELRRRLLATVALLAACRVGAFIPVPGVDKDNLANLLKSLENSAVGGILGLVDLFAGGALEQVAIFGLGVMPYISASIIFQLLASVVPALEKLQKEGEAGRRKINQYTRYATVFLCIVQGMMLLASMRAAFDANTGRADLLLGALIMTAGTMLLMWIGEQIDEYGIGNGVSLIIMAGIIARLPSQLERVLRSWDWKITPDLRSVNPFSASVLLVFFVGIVVGIIFITRGQRRIPFQQAKQMRGRRVYGGMKHYLPLQVNAAGVIPIIFASSLLVFPGIILGYSAQQFAEGSALQGVARGLNDALAAGTYLWTVLYVLLIFFFCYFWTAIQFNPTDMAENLRDHGSFIPGIRPGKNTASYLEKVMSRITLPGAAFLAAIAILPSLLSDVMGGEFQSIARWYGGTSLLIVVGVALDLVRKIESQLLMRHYEGFTRATRRRR